MKAILKTLATVVGLPTLVAALYFGLVASDVYVSEAKFSVRSAKGSSIPAGLGALLASPVLPAGGGGDGAVVMDYTSSLDMLRELSERIDVVAHYSDPDIDPLSRLDPDADRRELLEYFTRHVELERDALGSVFTLNVHAFDPETAHEMAELVIELNEDLVNTLSARIEEDAVSTAKSEMARAEARVRKAAADVNAFRIANDSLGPAEESAALFSRISGIESQLSAVQAELTEKRAFMREDSADIRTLVNRARALERQLGLEKGRAIGDAGTGLGSLIESYQPLVLEQEIAQQQYASALAAFEAARIDAQTKKQYLIEIVRPSLPDTATEPRRLVKVVTVAVFSFLAWLIGGLLWSALRDHIGH